MTECGVYLINGPEHQFYVGSTKSSFTNRWAAHRNQLRGNFHWCRELQEDWNLFGENYFTFTVIELCKPEECLARERFYMSKGAKTQLMYNARNKYTYIMLRNGLQFASQKEFAKACNALNTTVSAHFKQGRSYDDIAAYFGVQPMECGKMFDNSRCGDRIIWKLFEQENKGLDFYGV